MSYTAINGMRSTRYPMQGMAGPFLRDTGFRRQQRRVPGMFGLEGCISCGAIDEATEPKEDSGPDSYTGIQFGGTLLVIAGIGAAIYLLGK